MEKNQINLTSNIVGIVALVIMFCSVPAFAGAENEGIGETGTDPRDFAAKFMPYYRYTELKNGLEQQEFVLFGLVPFSPKFAMTYEIPLAYERDIRSTDGFKNGDPTLPGGPVIPGGVPTEGDGRETGIGDMNLRFFYRTDMDFLGGDWLVGSEFVFPTANEDVLGGEQFLVKPMITYVKDIGFWPAPGAFFALMNFYSFDTLSDSDREKVRMYIGRYFFMLPIHPSGIYTLPEVQFIYNFESDHASLWIGPEFGKMLAPGRIIYGKPGFGIDPDESEGDRDWSFEMGYRYFF
jgi:hypothetical protein